MPSVQPNMALTPSQVAMLPADQQQQYMKNLSPQQQAMVAQEIQNARIQGNRKFMRQSLEKYAYCPVSGGSGTTATYTPGTTLVFDLPVVGSGYAKGLLITFNLTVTLAAGTGATYALTAAGETAIFSEMLLNYNGAQCRLHPYILKVLDMTKGFSRGAFNSVVAGQNNATIANNVAGSTPVAAGSANTWTGKLYFPLNALGEDTVPGILPVMGVGNKPQLKLTCTPTFMNATVNASDPLLSPVVWTGGTGGALTSVTGTINVDMVYLDGTTMSDPNGLVLDLTSEPTLQYYWDTPLNPLTANTLNRQHIATLLEHWYVISIVIDGQSSTAFTTLANLQQFQLSADSVGQQNFLSINVSNNISVYDFYDRRRREYGQDLDVGVIPWVTAPTRGVVDGDNRNGAQVLNMQAGGYPAATHGYLVGSTSSTNFVPRVETFVISMNYAGLKLS